MPMKTKAKPGSATCCIQANFSVISHKVVLNEQSDLCLVIPGCQKQPIENAAHTTQTVLKAMELHQNDKQAATMNPHVQTLV